MGICASFDADTWFAYETVKIVRVRDKWLGFIQLFFKFTILCYIIIKVLVLDHSFNITDQPTGFVRLSLESPDTNTDYADFPYCPNNPNYENTWPFPQERMLPNKSGPIVCQKWEPQQVRFPMEELNSIFITTRASTQNQGYVCGTGNTNTNPTIESNCTTPYTLQGQANVAFLADIENYTLGIQHSYFSSQFNDPQFSGNSRDVNGVLRINGKIIREFPASKTSELPDVLRLGDILSYSNVNLTDPSKDNHNSLLYSGKVIVITVKYTNDAYNHKSVSYEYELHPIANSDYKLYELITAPGTNDVVSIKRAGVKIIFIVQGSFSRFSFQELLIQLVTALGLLSIANYSVDFLMCYVLKLRKYYRSFKYEQTETLQHLHEQTLSQENDKNDGFLNEQNDSFVSNGQHTEENLFYREA